MSKHEKSKFKQWFSLSRHKRRKGGVKISSELQDQSIIELKEKTIPINTQSSEYFYSCFKDLNEHFNYLRHEFEGKSELLFYHAKLIVLIRREIEIKKNMQLFNLLWEQEYQYLLDNLNLRWVISAVDTFIDYSDDKILVSQLLSTLILINSCKAYETEYRMLGIKNIDVENYNESYLDVNNPRSSVILFDGIPAFRIQRSDTFKNMYFRIKKVTSQHELSQAIFEKVYQKVHQEHTVFGRFSSCHTNEKNKWW